ncbi:F0F1 ATP synthase subunit A [Candidatus Methylomicrobium oryzae]|jgi:F-type H+-transporting ATPase subunit a|uniref:F0F1 ATP synthase subunit A n=1 Tax=Candidatus Methylomicrobium oryzae TaxID=2802053 RepID=UPI001922FA79|nr:F0F1 ATP synthase subunit A [Methylomicrobium sp. RS1]MBL1262795.1 F0F1 ATP synthase subunit A [Methylomicrobium sp. RS1]
MIGSELGAEIVAKIGPVEITNTVATTWGIMLLFTLLALLVRWQLQTEPNRLQTLVEAVLTAIDEALIEILPPDSVRRVLPFVATLWLFVLTANLVGLIPGLHSPTRDLSATSALAALVFAASHWFGIRGRGLKNHFRHYIEPSIILLPFHIISEISRTLALAVRLFGNMMSLEMAALLVLLIAGFLVPVPLLMLHVVEAVIQAYIFGMLALIYIAGALEAEANETTSNSSEENHE